MTEEKAPTYITELKTDLINHIDSSINALALTIYNTVVLKEDIVDMATKHDIKEIRDEMATKSDIAGIHKVIGSYEVRARNIEDILLKDHKPRIVDLEREVYLK